MTCVFIRSVSDPMAPIVVSIDFVGLDCLETQLGFHVFYSVKMVHVIIFYMSQKYFITSRMLFQHADLSLYKGSFVQNFY